MRATYLNHPIFEKLLVHAEEEYGFTNQGPLTIPCDESLFEKVLRFVSSTDHSGRSNRFVDFEELQRYCHVGVNAEFWSDCRPLLNGPLVEKTVW